MSASVNAGIDPPGQTPLWADTPSRPPSRADTLQADNPRQTTPPGKHPPPPADGYYCGRYASYWDAFLSSHGNGMDRSSLLDPLLYCTLISLEYLYTTIYTFCKCLIFTTIASCKFNICQASQARNVFDLVLNKNAFQ